jgi:signal transduction histidine kinase
MEHATPTTEQAPRTGVTPQQSRSPRRSGKPDGGAPSRILVVDDNASVLEVFRKILGGGDDVGAEALNALEASLFATDVPAPAPRPSFLVDLVQDGEEAYHCALKARRDHRAYAVAFVDMRMPGGWDGVTTIEALWRADPNIEVVICTAHSDHSWDKLIARLGRSDRLLILRKPFDKIEVFQLACALSDKWHLQRERQDRLDELERQVEERTQHLRLALSESGRAEQALARTNDELKQTNRNLQDAHKELLQSEKMASIGQLAAGVAHEINNPLGFVNCNLGSLEIYCHRLVEVIEAYERSDDVLVAFADRLHAVQAVKQRVELEHLAQDVFALLDESKKGLQRVTKIVQDLKEFSHVGQAEWRLCDLHCGLDSTLSIANNELKYKATVVKQYGDLPDVECLPSEINQVFMNLLVNAAQAIATRGEVTIRTGVQDSKVWVDICDTGEGIAPEHLQRIFDPFFTTKPPGKGTGLGLSLCYRIVEKHRGRIEVDSTLGSGTRFRVWLPIKRAEAAVEDDPAP